MSFDDLLELANSFGASKRPSTYILILLFVVLSTDLLFKYSKQFNVQYVSLFLIFSGIIVLCFGLFDIKHPQYLLGFFPGFLSIGLGVAVILLAGMRIYRYPIGVYYYLAAFSLLLSCFFIGINKIEKLKQNPLSLAIFSFTPVTDDLNNFSKTIHNSILSYIDRTNRGENLNFFIIDMEKDVPLGGTPDQRVTKAMREVNNAANVIVFGDMVKIENIVTISPYIVATYPFSSISEIVFALPKIITSGKMEEIQRIEEDFIAKHLDFVFGFKLFELGDMVGAERYLTKSNLPIARYYLAAAMDKRFSESHNDLTLLRNIKNIFETVTREISTNDIFYWPSHFGLARCLISLYQYEIPHQMHYLTCADSIVEMVINFPDIKRRDPINYYKALSQKGLIMKFKSNFYTNKEQYDLLKSSLDFFNEAYEYFKGTNEKVETAAILFNSALTTYDLSIVGLPESQQGYISQSQELFMKAIISYKQLDNISILPDVYYSYGDALKRYYRFLKDKKLLDKAYSYYKLSYQPLGKTNPILQSFLLNYKKAILKNTQLSMESDLDEAYSLENEFIKLFDSRPKDLDTKTSCEILRSLASIESLIGIKQSDQKRLLRSNEYYQEVLNLASTIDESFLLSVIKESIQSNNMALDRIQNQK